MIDTLRIVFDLNAAREQGLREFADAMGPQR